MKNKGQSTYKPLSKILAKVRYLKAVGIIKGGVLVDIGCGSDGILLQKLSNRITQGYGFDRSIPELGVSSGNIQLIHTYDLEKGIPFNDNTADYVTMLAVLEHMNNPDYILAEMHRILKPGGTLFLTVPTWFGKPILEFMAFKLHVSSEEHCADHKRYFNKIEMLKLLEQAFGTDVKPHIRYFELGCNLEATIIKKG